MNAIESLMKTELIEAKRGETVAAVANRMAENQVGALLVRDGGALRGMFSERDLLRRVVGEGRDPTTTTVESVMTTDVVSADVSTPLKEVLDLFREHHVRHLPILRAGTPVGILSTRDFLGFLVEGLERFIEDAMYSRQILDGADPYDHMGGSYAR